MNSTSVAIAQVAPVILDKAASVARAADAVKEAARGGAQLVAFAESWIGGYPGWAFGHAGWDDPVARSLYKDLLRESVSITPEADGVEASDDLWAIRQAAKDTGVVVIIGANERSTGRSGSVYNSLITIGVRGETLNVHRKSTPTMAERLVHAAGDAAGIRAVDTPAGRVGGLICWEHWNPLIRAAAHAGEEEIHVAAWPDFPEAHQLATRSFAFEGRCYAIAAAQYLPQDAVPKHLQDAFRQGTGTPSGGPFFTGGSAIADPYGQWILEPQYEAEGIFIRDLNLGEVLRAHYDLDVSGHYGRPDLFQLRVTADRRSPVSRSWSDD